MEPDFASPGRWRARLAGGSVPTRNAQDVVSEDTILGTWHLTERTLGFLD